jgi:hypothetical protein
MSTNVSELTQTATDLLKQISEAEEPEVKEKRKTSIFSKN